MGVPRFLSVVCYFQSKRNITLWILGSHTGKEENIVEQKKTIIYLKSMIMYNEEKVLWHNGDDSPKMPFEMQFIAFSVDFPYNISINIVARVLHMARSSTKENKNIYHKTREALDLTREAASELLEGISPERIEKIENERSLPHPDEVLLMAEKYKQPSLCNHYCANQCPIGQQYVPEIKIKDLSQIVLEMLASLNSMSKQKERLIEITVDGKITGDELEDFIYIQEELERISIAVETLQLWSERMLATGVIDAEQYNAHKNK